MLSDMSDSCTVYWKCDESIVVLEEVLSHLGQILVELDAPQIQADFSISGVPDTNIARLRGGERNWSGINLPLRSQLGGDLTRSLAAKTGRPAIAFFEIDQAAWGFSLLRPDLSAFHFVNRPGFLALQPQEFTVSADILGGSFGIPSQRVADYLEHIDADDPAHAFAYPTDEFELGDHWVRTDVMRALGLLYPDPNDDMTKPYAIEVAKPKSEATTRRSYGRGLMDSLFSKFRRG